MTNRRRTPVANSYQSDFLHSRAWFARRARWFRTAVLIGQPLKCAVCAQRGAAKDFELHHLDYGGVTQSDRGWRAFERHTDLVPMHPSCHETLHRLIDRDTVLSRQRTRRDASITAIQLLQAQLKYQERNHE